MHYKDQYDEHDPTCLDSRKCAESESARNQHKKGVYLYMQAAA